MPYQITEECLNCGVCLDECPTGATLEGEEFYQINPNSCDECGNCKEVCPAEAAVER